ncbi:unnamed protein product [Calicophoron daubneyi]|uniref:Uncharacterized protein n=1 Tax=Calicophoron daubneyi TaxID=300641 RepID=A0AAV2T1P7_CALDB
MVETFLIFVLIISVSMADYDPFVYRVRGIDPDVEDGNEAMVSWCSPAGRHCTQKSECCSFICQDSVCQKR